MPLHSRSHSHGQDNNSSSSSTNQLSTSSLVQAAQALTSIAAPNVRIPGAANASGTVVNAHSLNPSSERSSSSTQVPSTSQQQYQTQQQRPPQLQHQQYHQQPSQQHLYQSQAQSHERYPPQRPTDPVQLQQLTGNPYSSQQQQQQQQHQQSAAAASAGSQPYVPYPGGATGSSGRPDALSIRTMSAHRPSGSINYSNPQDLNSPSSNASKYTPTSLQAGVSPGGMERKYNHPNSLPSYNSSAVGDPYNGMVGSTNGRYLAPWGIYATDWCKWPVTSGGNGLGGYGRVAIGSYSEDSHNCIQILSSAPVAQSRHTGHHSDMSHQQPTIEFTKLAEATHTYPITRVLWEPPTSSKPFTDLLATSGDHLRLWSLPNTNAASAPNPPSNTITRQNIHQAHPQKLTALALLSNSKSNDSTAPLTSLDWNTISPALIITSSIDTTCTVWDIPTLTAKTQLIAHDKEVYDVRFMSNSVDVFASCGADGSVRMFDLRSLEHSTIIYEPSAGKSGSGPDGQSPTSSMLSPPPLLRLAASPHDQHLIATFSQDSNVVRILDVRQPGQALIELRGHSNNVNCIEWAPSRRGYIAAGGDDCLVLVWDLLNSSTSVPLNPPGSATSAPTPGANQGPIVGQQESHARTPVMVWRGDWEVNNISWSPPTTGGGQSEWLGVVGGRGIWGVKL